MRKLLLLIYLLSALPLCAQLPQGYKKAYTLFDAAGHEVGYKQMIDSLRLADVVFVGEIHNCSIAHWMEREIAQSLYEAHGSKLSLGAEMFEADNQLILDEYLSGTISSERFEAEARLWPNYATDYAPLVEMAKEYHLPFIATNVPRRYANTVSRKGLQALDALSSAAKKFLPPLPLPFESDAATQATFEMMGAMGGGHKHDALYLEQAQAVKDATMAWFIAQNCTHHFLHFNGNFHTNHRKGIIAYLHRYAPRLKVKTVCTVRQETIDHLGEEQEGRADFYICVPESMTNTY